MEDIKGLGSVADLLKRFDAARKRWELWRSLHQEAYDFAAPERETFRFRSPGQRKNRHVFDSTAIIGLQQFANKVQASVIPSWQQWMSLQPGDLIPEDEKKGVEEGLEKATDTFFMHLNHSNFSTEISPALVDLGIGTGGMLVEEGEFGTEDPVLKFTNIPLAECYPEAPASGNIKSSWRLQEIEVGSIETAWPGAELPQQLVEKAKTSPNTKVKVVSGMIHNRADDKYWHVVIYEPAKHMMFKQAFDTNRMIIFRWHVVPGEVFGRGPIMQMLPDIRTANKVKQFILENAAIQMAGVYTGVDDGIFNPHTARIAPGVVLPVGSNASQNPTLQALPRAGDIGLGGVVLEDLQDNIKKALFSDPLGEITDPVKSATEQMIRQQNMLKDSGASFGRLKSEMVEPIATAIVDILSSRGLIPRMTVDGKEVTLRQESPLAKAEDIEDFQSLQMYMGFLSGMPQEIVVASIKIEDIPEYAADKLNIPARFNRSEDERKKLVATGIEVAQQGGQLEQGATQPV